MTTGLTDPFMIPYVLALGATPAEAGLLSSARNGLLALVQLAAGRAIGWAGSRRRVVLITVGLQALLWFPLAFADAWFGAHAVAAVIALYTLVSAAAALAGPAWGSLIADYVEADERGRFFGRRARLGGLSSTAAGLAAGGVLEAAGPGTGGFRALLLGGGASRLLTWRALRVLHDRGWREDPHLHFGFLAFLRRAPRSNFARFSLCLAASGFAAHVAAPYFAVFLLQERGFSYATYTAVMLSGSLTGTLSSPWWGRLTDRLGNHAVLRWTMAGVTILPALWLAVPHPLWLLAANAVGAFLWGGLNLAAANFVYDAVSPPRRHTCIAYFNVLNGVGVALGALLGGRLYEAFQALHPAPYAVVFYASVALRIAAALAFAQLVREVREVRAVGLREAILDLVGQRVVAFLGLFSTRDERSTLHPRRPDRER